MMHENHHTIPEGFHGFLEGLKLLNIITATIPEHFLLLEHHANTSEISSNHLAWSLQSFWDDSLHEKL